MARPSRTTATVRLGLLSVTAVLDYVTIPRMQRVFDSEVLGNPCSRSRADSFFGSVGTRYTIRLAEFHSAHMADQGETNSDSPPGPGEGLGPGRLAMLDCPYRARASAASD